MTSEGELSDLEYESACVAALRRKLQVKPHHFDRVDRVIEGIELRGWPRTTQVVIHYLKEGEARQRAWSLWEGDLVIQPGLQQDPDGLATIVDIQMREAGSW
jgi:hypothetical protein